MSNRDVYMAVEIVTNPKSIKSIPNQKYQKICNISNPIRTRTLNFSDISDDENYTYVMATIVMTLFIYLTCFLPSFPKKYLMKWVLKGFWASWVCTLMLGSRSQDFLLLFRFWPYFAKLNFKKGSCILLWMLFSFL